MSTVTKIEINRQFTLNLGNYESARLGISMTIDIGPDDDPDVEYDKLLDKIDQKLQDEIEAFS